MKLCITGVSGQLGKELYTLSPYETYGTYLAHRPLKEDSCFFRLDITNERRVHSLLKKIKPDWVAHLASETNVDLCEENKYLAWRSNVLGVKHVVDACRNVNARLLLVSSDGVFDGRKRFYKEIDVPNPINFYGRTRLMGEWLAHTYPDTLITRTSSLYSSTGKFASWVLSAAQQGTVTALTDLYLCPTLTSEIASCLLAMMEKDLRGLYHTVGDERVSKYTFVRQFVQTFGYDPSIVKPIAIKDVPFIAKRPRDLSLDITKIKKEGISFSRLPDAMKKLKKHVNSLL